MALTLSGTDGVVGAGFTLDASGASVTAGVGTFGSFADIKVGSAVTISSDGDVFATGITTVGVKLGLTLVLVNVNYRFLLKLELVLELVNLEIHK